MKFKLKPFNRNVTDEELLKDLVEAQAKLAMQEKSLTFRSYTTIGKYSSGTIAERFGSWNSGLQKAGLIPNEEKNVPVELLLDNIKMVWISKGRQPVYRDMNKPPSQFTGSTYNARFGGWRNALEQFIAVFEKEQHDLVDYEAEVEKSKHAKRTKRDPSLSLRFLVLRRDNFSCVACGRSPSVVPGLILEVDHIQAWSKGGETIEKNLRTLCFDCNRGKAAT